MIVVTPPHSAASVPEEGSSLEISGVHPFQHCCVSAAKRIVGVSCRLT